VEDIAMAQRIPDEYRDLFEKRAFGHIATVMPDGSPQVTPVWVDYDGTYILVNSARGRVKDRNMEQRRNVAIEISDPDNPYRYLAVRGPVVEITEEGADAHIDELAKKYTGADRYANHRPDQIRCIYKIKPERVDAHG
jgi:PPOX class probable F420-dependent enzyme